MELMKKGPGKTFVRNVKFNTISVVIILFAAIAWVFVALFLNFGNNLAK